MRAPTRTFESARRLRRAMTLPEVQLWTALRGAAIGARVRRQHPIGPYVLDFYVSSAKVAIEIDGAAHDLEVVARRDAVRDTWLGANGIRVLRFNASDVLDARRRIDVLDTIVACVSSPALAGGGGGPDEA